MEQFWPLFKREFLGYFRSPVAYVFIVIFLLASVGCTFFLGRLFDSNQASLDSFFQFLPWLFLVLIPAVGMRLWAEERKTGTIELLFTLPVDLGVAVVTKFLAGWVFVTVALLLTFPLAITVNYLGDPANGIIFTGYLGSFLMAGAYLAVSCVTSALTKNQIVSFILAIVICFVLVLIGWGVFTDIMAAALPGWLINFISGLGFITHFQSLSKGLIDSRDLLYFGSVIGFSLAVNATILTHRKSS